MSECHKTKLERERRMFNGMMDPKMTCSGR